MQHAKPLQAPILNMNGASAENLIQEFQSAYLALNEALSTMARAHPHGRDFQTAEDPPVALATAIEQHESRMATVRSIMLDYQDLAIAVQRQQAR